MPAHLRNPKIVVVVPAAAAAAFPMECIKVKHERRAEKRQKEEEDWEPLQQQVTLKPHISSWKPGKDALDFTADELYDATADEEDEAFVRNTLREGDGKSDAILCCPACFTPVSYQCQRHPRYILQYHATLAVNCRLRPRQQQQEETDQQNDLTWTTSAETKNISLVEVICEKCQTVVGTKQKDLFIFFNVLPSEP